MKGFKGKVLKASTNFLAEAFSEFIVGLIIKAEVAVLFY
ncbi:hypothetical protein imdm_1334 [gamma proteobacterium IMCC2047]|nr:hypothetical protein imdm_1334 [gamma proteobacterium IMCC2047]